MSGTHAPFRIGTRGSELALVQARMTEVALSSLPLPPALERVIITTTGDRRTDVSLAQLAKAEGIFDKGVFIKELEQALAEKTIDLAVHSLKDMPTVLEEGFALAAVLPRAPVRDVLITRAPGGFSALEAGARIGTSSVRRARQIAFLRDSVAVKDIRGNVPTRLRKLADGADYDAILLAEAGLVRLGLLPLKNSSINETIIGFPGLHVTRLAENVFFPAAGQGAVGLEIRSDDTSARALAEQINHLPTWRKITAEREFLRLLEAGCHTPVGVYSQLDETTGTLRLHARVFPESGGLPRLSEATGTDPLETARALFDNLSHS